MGWFDDNHPMDADAEAVIDEFFGLNKWYKDPQVLAYS
jgi:hypothetical protein